ncbi:MAG TPA: hypothetical protein VLL54_00535 [Pyrinomonadaceae bacterium]|nr:hypothetical protein [Pyrinomonadaceae bacterium]
MKKIVFLAVLFTLTAGTLNSQTKPAGQTPRQQQPSPVTARDAVGFDLSDYGVSFPVEPRLIVMMAALEAAGFDPVPPGSEPSAFRAQVRRDLASLDPDLRNRLRTFYERNKLPAPATAADQAARYVSLAFVLDQPPLLEAPARSEDLPTSLLEVLDFAPLVKEFYRRSNIDQNLPSYTVAYQAEANRLRKPTADMIRGALTYLHTRPMTIAADKVAVKAPGTQKKNAPKTYTYREHSRNFYIVTDLLAAPGAINFRVIGDEYFVVVPEGTDPTSSELRRGYLQYVIDPLVLKYNREIAARREQIKAIIAEREKAKATISPDAFLAVTRSLVAAADARYDEARKLESLNQQARVRLAGAKDDNARRAIAQELQEKTKELQDETIARLADDYEQGAILSFYFSDQLKGLESSGFDIASFLSDMIASFDPAREAHRLDENAEARKRAQAIRQARLVARRAEAAPPIYSEAEAARAAQLVKKLGEVEQILRLKDYNNAEIQLKELLKDYSREPRIFFALAQTSSLAAADAIDEDVQSQRLNRALGNYRLAIEAASSETDRSLLSRAHEAMGRIYAFLDNNAEAAKAFDEAIKIGEVPGGAYQDALEGKRKLGTP